MKLLIVGRPGAGKGTQASMIDSYYQIPHISTGEIFRKAINASTDIAKKLKSIMLSGGLIDDDTTNEIVKNLKLGADVKYSTFDKHPGFNVRATYNFKEKIR